MGGSESAVTVKWERKAYGRKGWVVRQNGKYARAAVRKEALRQKFWMPRRAPVGLEWVFQRRWVQYTRSYVYTEWDDPGSYYTVDVVVTEEVPYDFDASDMDQRWSDPELKRKMENEIYQMSGKVEYVSQLDVTDRRKNIGGSTWAFGSSDPFFQNLKHLKEKSGAYWAKYKR